jgi:hypothetical protein
VQINPARARLLQQKPAAVCRHLPLERRRMSRNATAAARQHTGYARHLPPFRSVPPTHSHPTLLYKALFADLRNTTTQIFTL